MAERKGLERAARAVQAAARRAPRPRDLAAKAQFPLRAPTVPLTVEPPEPERKLLGDYETDWARKQPARYARFFVTEGLVRPAVAGLARPERRGRDRLDGLEGPAIFAANHHSHLDIGLLITSLPESHRHRVFAAAAADYFFDNRVKATLSALALNAIPIERTKVGRRSANDSADLIEAGWSMIIFPEGGRSPDGWGQPFKGGAAYLAIRTGVPLVPVHLAGTGRVLPKGRGRPKPGRTVVTFGAPIHPREGERTNALNDRLAAAVAELADEATTDWWSARRRAATGETPTLSAPDGAGRWRRAWALSAKRDRRRNAKRRWPDLD